MRWFAPGVLPEGVATWFEDTAPYFDIETRVDSYLLTGRPDLGVKRRDRGPIEVKERRRVGGALTVGGRLAARVEEWHKHTDDGYAGAGGRWVDIQKTVTTYRYRARGATSATVACDVELAAIDASGIAAWTMALEASGPRPARHSALQSAFEEFLSDTVVPGSVADALELDAGYPAWLIETLGGRRNGRN